jgi:hypothetical protein
VLVEVARPRSTRSVDRAHGVIGDYDPCLKRRSKSIDRERCYGSNFRRHICP